GVAGDHAVDADELALEIPERAAGVAVVDGRVVLDGAPVREVAAEHAVLARDDAEGDDRDAVHRETERVAGRDAPLSLVEVHARLAADGNTFELVALLLEAQQRDVVLRDAVGDLHRMLDAVAGDDFKAVRLLDDVLVREHPDLAAARL